MLTGTVKRTLDAKGYGFVSRPGGPDLFFHFSMVHGDKIPALRDRVTYDIVESVKGEQAINVTVVQHAIAS